MGKESVWVGKGRENWEQGEDGAENQQRRLQQLQLTMQQKLTRKYL